MRLFARTGWRYPLLIIALLIGAIGLRIADPLFLQNLRLIAFSVYQRIDVEVPNPDSPVRVVAVDEASLERVGPWPWPRDVMALLLQRLADQGAVVVAFDVLFPDSEGSDDDAFVAALAAVPTILPIAPTDQPADDPLPVAKSGIAIVGDDPRPFIPAFTNVITNQTAFDAAAAGLGTIDREQNNGIAFRRIPLLARVGDAILPALPVEVLRVVEGADLYTVTVSVDADWMSWHSPPGIREIGFGGITVPTGRDGSMLLGAQPVDRRNHISASALLDGENDPGGIAGRIVLVGLIGADSTRTDPQGPVSQIAVQAQAIEHILSGRVLIRPGAAQAIEIAVVLILGGFLAWLLPRLKPIAGIVAGMIAVGLVLIGGWLSFSRLGLLLDPVWPALSVWVLAAVAVLYLLRRLNQQRVEIHRAFGDVLAPEIADAIHAEPDRVVLTGETRELTVMSCRIRNLAVMAERMEARDLVSLANGIHAVFNQAVVASRGTISRNTGDTIVAFWNAPLDDDHHADQACSAASDAIRGVRRLNAQLRRQPSAEADNPRYAVVGIGISTGSCCVGNLGAGDRFAYSAVGEEIHLSARFQGLAEFYGVPVVVGESTVKRMNDPRVLELDRVRVKGRPRPVRLFTLLGAIEGRDEVLETAAAAQASLVSAYRERKWDQAEAALTTCIGFRIEGLENLNSIYRTRLAMVREIAPPEGWDGTDVTVRL